MGSSGSLSWTFVKWKLDSALSPAAAFSDLDQLCREDATPRYTQWLNDMTDTRRMQLRGELGSFGMTQGTTRHDAA